MTKSELIERLAKHYPQLVMKDAEVVVQTILDVMCHSLMDGQRVEIRGFGVFNLHYRPPRDGRNPKSGEAVKVPAKYVLIQGRQGTARTSKNQITLKPLIVTKKATMAKRLHAPRQSALLLMALLLWPAVSFAQLNVIISGGFRAAYLELLPDFERATGIKVNTTFGGSQGTGPEHNRCSTSPKRACRRSDYESSGTQRTDRRRKDSRSKPTSTWLKLHLPLPCVRDAQTGYQHSRGVQTNAITCEVGGY
jgi:integration host factor subunit beta